MKIEGIVGKYIQDLIKPFYTLVFKDHTTPLRFGAQFTEALLYTCSFHLGLSFCAWDFIKLYPIHKIYTLTQIIVHRRGHVLNLMVTRPYTMALLQPSFQPPVCRAHALPLGSFLLALSYSLTPPQCVVSFVDVPRGVGTGTIRMMPCFQEQTFQQPSLQRYRDSLHSFLDHALN